MKAFPQPSLTVTDNGQVLAFTVSDDGMDLRDYFAGKALTGLTSQSVKAPPGLTAKLAYEYADAMMKARIE